jgi:hypothetical protein
MEVIANSRSLGHDYPYWEIAYREMILSSLEEVADWGESRIKPSGPTYKTLSLEEIQINSHPALLRHYNYQDWRSKIIDCYHVYLLNDKDAYTIQMCSVEGKIDSTQLQSVWREMINSISLQ